MSPALTRRSLLAGGGAAAAVAVSGPVLAGTPASFSSLVAQFNAANAAYDRVCAQISEPARERRAAAVAAAKAGVPHVEMTFDMSWSEWSDRPTKTYSTSDRLNVACAQATAERIFEPAESWSDDQHRHFAEVRKFHARRLERDAAIARAVAEAEAQYDASAEIAQEEAAWDEVVAFGGAIVDYRPRSLDELAAKLKWQADTCWLPDEALLDHFIRDVGMLGGAA